MSETSRTIAYGDEDITFSVIFCDRRTLDISVHPDRHITVKAPINAQLEEVDKRVKNHARWILKQQQFFSQFEPRTPPRQYVGGETHLYLGRQYRLKIEQHSVPAVKLVGRHLRVQTPQPDCLALTHKMVEQWYLERAQDKFSERLDFCFVPFRRLGFDCPKLFIRQFAKRWGSLTAAGKISLNRDLIRAPYICIDYVITHELCHLKHPDHSKNFYDFLSSVMPDWVERKQKLEQVLI
jgi:predicted metal-dependent hydrolase